MNGIHDMGGMHGFGPIKDIDQPVETVFHDNWEGHVRAIQWLTVGGKIFNLDAFRYGIERMAPAHYLRASYYERWLSTIEYNLIQAGVVTADELDARMAELGGSDHAPSPPERVLPATPPPTPDIPEPLPSIEPRFAVGDAVVTRNVQPTGHTRLPRYARGKRCVIHMVHGPEIFADTHAHGLGEHPHTVYNVRFDAQELWGESAEPRQVVSIDLWESYLEPASS
jgi:nitrile hydratase subunit beta